MVLNDPNWKNLEKLLDSSLAYKDYIRQGFISGYSTLLNSRTTANKKSIDDIDDSQFRICKLNVNYQLCKSYPFYRHCDVFDVLYAEIQSELRDELE